MDSIVSLLTQHRLRRLEGRRLNSYSLHVARLLQGEKSGWVRFHLVAAGDEGEFTPPVVEGIYSASGRGMFPWIEALAYYPQLRCGEKTLALSANGTDVAPFSALSELIPPAATEVGAALFHAGFRKVKLFYLAEAGWEGQQKLWAEKPLHEEMEQEWDATTARDLQRFLSAPVQAAAAAACVPWAVILLKELEEGEKTEISAANS
jgi:hypothetical protein